ncbi:uncharacterized protein EKO05_0008754 [Ascochyta rabiei]|uniref:Uncharacterized protein n=1 Tax=Didymella rabiei TaxID=5454 RepID=A0A162ZVJ2_DIDRA|nr:uncharacterized protein EKO05_0008754 [Ascochyta rabiei]KZM20832.1 hypothetical protein ST47_g8040 [Ascochyta rabiei]UPX18455.1 hypothetical protein EKO05_0008754 [Ascochyta rabiei]
MEYIKRLLDHPPTLLRHLSPHPTSQSFPKSPSDARGRSISLSRSAQPLTERASKHRHRRRRRKYRHSHDTMSHFSGPWSRDLAVLKKSISSIPSDNKAPFASASNDTVDIFCDPEALHVWETDSDIDSLLQLISVLAKLCDLGVRGSKNVVKGMKGAMIIIADDSRGREAFQRLRELVEYITGETGSKRLEGTVCAYANTSIVVVRGWNYRPSSYGTGKYDVEKVVKRVGTTLERALSVSKTRKIVWHHGAVVGTLLSFINTTTSFLRNAVAGISVTNSLHLANGVKPSPAGRSNTLPDLERLQSYAKKLGIPVLFLDSSTQSITSPNLGTYMYFFAYYIYTFLPSSLTRPHLHTAQDELVTFAFRLRGASERRYGSDVVSVVKKHLDPRSKVWARRCVDARSYGKRECEAAGKESEVHHSVQLADAPFCLFKDTTSRDGGGVAAFSRLAVGPASPAAAVKEVFVAAPVDISFSTSRLRVSGQSNFHVLLPKENITEENVTNRIQGLMMGVLERVRQEHGNPSFSSSERQMWKDTVKACSWALKGCKGKMPDKIAEKVKFVQEKLTKGTWGYVVGAPGDETKAAPVDNGSGAASANAAAHAAFAGVGQNAYEQGSGQHQMQMGSNQMGSNGYASHEQQGMMNLPTYAPENPYPPQASAQDQQPSGQMGIEPAMYHQGPGNGYGQIYAGYGQGAPPPPEHKCAPQMAGGYPSTPQRGYAQVQSQW